MRARRPACGGWVRRLVPGVLVAGLLMVVGCATGATGESGVAGSAGVAGATGIAGAEVGPSGGSRPVDVLMAGGKGPKAPANSLDWAGYAVTGTSLTSAVGSWTQPTASCSGTKASQSAFWVGVDGYASTDPTVQQIGTDADCTKGTKKVPGGASYYAWYELYPDAIVTLDTVAHPVYAGDNLSATVTGSGSTYTLTLTDFGRWTFSTVQVTPIAPMATSAEWIAEAPSSCKGTKCKAVALTDFGSVTFSGVSADSLPVDPTSPSDHQITMTKNKKGTIVEATPSSLSGGSGFTVTWVSP